MRRLLLLVALLLPLGCTGHGSARRAEIARPAALAANAPSGPYLATFSAPLVGEISCHMTATPTGDGFIATTRPGVAWDFIGGIESLLGPLFLPKLFPDGTILTWRTGLPSGDSGASGWLGAGAYKSAGVNTSMRGRDRPIELSAPDGRKVAVMRFEPDPAPDRPMADYPALVERIESAFQTRLFDRSLSDSSQVRAYLRRLRATSRRARDDVEFVFAAVLAGRSYVKFSLPLVFKNADLASRALADDWNKDDLATISVSFDENSKIATIRADAFLDAADVDRAFERALAHHPGALLLDIHTCPGVTLASLRALSWIIDSDLDAGTFFGPNVREQVLRGDPGAAPVMTLDSSASVAVIEAQLDTGNAAHIIVKPVSPGAGAPGPFRGPVAALISKRSTTSAEPLAFLLQSSGRARLFGERTAGRPLLSRPAGIGQGWVLWLAAADYRGPGGEKLNGNGIRPDENLSKIAARNAARAWLAESARQSPRP